MSREIRAFGLLLTISVVLSIAISPAAQAAQFHANHNGNVSVFGNQTQQLFLTTDAGQIGCTQALFEGTITNSSSQATTDELTLTPTITGCQALGQAATIDTNGCKLTVTGTDTSGQTYASNTVNVDITGCTSGKSIEVTTGICRLTITQQHHLSHAVGATTGQDIEVNITLTGVHYISDGPLCPNMPTGTTKTNGSLVGKATFQAREDTGSQQATHNGHQYQKLLQTGQLKSLSGT